MRAIAEEERLMPHFHLSAQSGDDMILKRMKRRHARADTIAFCEDVRRAAPRSRIRRRPDRGISDRNRGDVRETLTLVDDAGLSLPARLSRSARARARRRRACRSLAAPSSRTRGRAAARGRARRRWRRAGRAGRQRAGPAGRKARASAARRVSRRCAFDGRAAAGSHRRGAHHAAADDHLMRNCAA